MQLPAPLRCKALKYQPIHIECSDGSSACGGVRTTRTVAVSAIEPQEEYWLYTRRKSMISTSYPENPL